MPTQLVSAKPLLRFVLWTIDKEGNDKDFLGHFKVEDTWNGFVKLVSDSDKTFLIGIDENQNILEFFRDRVLGQPVQIGVKKISIIAGSPVLIETIREASGDD